MNTPWPSPSTNQSASDQAEAPIRESLIVFISNDKSMLLCLAKQKLMTLTEEKNMSLKGRERERKRETINSLACQTDLIRSKCFIMTCLCRREFREISCLHMIKI